MPPKNMISVTRKTHPQRAGFTLLLHVLKMVLQRRYRECLVLLRGWH